MNNEQPKTRNDLIVEIGKQLIAIQGQLKVLYETHQTTTSPGRSLLSTRARDSILAVHGIWSGADHYHNYHFNYHFN